MARPAMLTKLLLLSFIVLVGCGKQVSIPNSLERLSSVTEGESEKSEKVGMLNRGDVDAIEVDGKSYKVSPFSSQQALSFISSFPKGSKVAVKFFGILKSTDVIVQNIQ